MARFAASQKAPKGVGGPGVDPDRPWVNPEKAAAAENAGNAGKILHAALQKSKSIGLGKSL